MCLRATLSLITLLICIVFFITHETTITTKLTNSIATHDNYSTPPAASSSAAGASSSSAGASPSPAGAAPSTASAPSAAALASLQQ